ncbi:ParB/Srx family N-terminal domain-containing protein [Acinetobacter proteolyticus]|uniref:ParB/Srx family N-terminal domain-containing protein n=1 Tax=Acinetobacter proteolyticus TaxID=1776741 RepID=UPI0031E191E6
MNRNNFKLVKLSVSSILLDQNNPRIRVANTQEECFQILMDHPAEQTALISLAKHIAKNGISIEPIVVSKSDDGKKYIVRDGNRRIMALKMLLNPKTCPDISTRKIFETLKNKYIANIDKKVDVYFSSDENSIIEYIELKHTGENGGIGQRQWSAFLQSYFGMKNEKNAKYKRAAQLLLWMEARKYSLNSDFPITTLARFLSIDYLNKFGFEVTDERIFVRENYDWKKTYHVFKVILDNITNKKINVSRNKNNDSDSVINIADAEEILQKYVDEGIKNYEEEALNQPENDDVKPENDNKPDNENPDNGGKPGRPVKPGTGGKPEKPKKLKNIVYSNNLNEILCSKPEYNKLQTLYSSLCMVSAEQHTPLVTVGIWAFIESLANLYGKTTGDFYSFFGNFINQKLSKGNKNQKHTDFKKSLEYFNSEGNMSKHSSIAMTLDSATVINKFSILEEFFIAVLEDMQKQE